MTGHRPQRHSTRSAGVAFSLGTFNHLNFPIVDPYHEHRSKFLLQIDGLPRFWERSFHPRRNAQRGAVCVPQHYPVFGCGDCELPFLNDRVITSESLLLSLLLLANGGATTVNQFITQENRSEHAGLYGVITNPISVPEPAPSCSLPLRPAFGGWRGGAASRLAAFSKVVHRERRASRRSWYFCRHCYSLASRRRSIFPSFKPPRTPARESRTRTPWPASGPRNRAGSTPHSPAPGDCG